MKFGASSTIHDKYLSNKCDRLTQKEITISTVFLECKHISLIAIEECGFLIIICVGIFQVDDHRPHG